MWKLRTERWSSNLKHRETEENEIQRHSTHRKNKLQTSNYIMNKDNTLTLLSPRCFEVSKHSCDRSENQNLPRLSLNTLWLLASWTGNTAITSEMIKNLFNSVKKTEYFSIQMLRRVFQDSGNTFRTCLGVFFPNSTVLICFQKIRVETFFHDFIFRPEHVIKTSFMAAECVRLPVCCV